MVTTSDLAIQHAQERRKQDKRDAKAMYAKLRIALCDIEGGMANTLQEARDIAAAAVRSTPPAI